MKRKLKQLIKLHKRLAANARAQAEFNLDLSETTIGVDLEFQVKRHQKLLKEEEQIEKDLGILIHGGGTGED